MQNSTLNSNGFMLYDNFVETLDKFRPIVKLQKQVSKMKYGEKEEDREKK